MPVLPPQASIWSVYACRTPFLGEIAEIVRRRCETIGVLVDNLPYPELSRYGLVISPDSMTCMQLRMPAIIALTTPAHRQLVVAQARGRGVTWFPPLVDPTAVVAATALLAEGCVVNGLAMIGADSRLGCFVHVNRTASIGHDALIEDYATIGPGVVLAGFVRVGRGAFIGAGAQVAPNLRIGDNAVVAVGARCCAMCRWAPW